MLLSELFLTPVKRNALFANSFKVLSGRLPVILIRMLPTKKPTILSIFIISFSKAYVPL
jgi:hypothetical protein